MKDVWSKRNVNLVLLIIGVSLNRVWLRSVVTSLLDQIHQFDLLDQKQHLHLQLNTAVLF